MEIIKHRGLQQKYKELSLVLNGEIKEKVWMAKLLLSVLIFMFLISAASWMLSILVFITIHTIAAFVMIPLSIIFLGTPIFLIISRIYITYFLERVTKINELFLQKARTVDTIDLLLEDLKSILHYIRILSILRWFHFVSLKFLVVQFEYFIMLIAEIRSDILINISRQEDLLNQAKLEAETYIQWTTALKQTSELQKARIDMQIMQFEELQKIILKV